MQPQTHSETYREKSHTTVLLAPNAAITSDRAFTVLCDYAQPPRRRAIDTPRRLLLASSPKGTGGLDHPAHYLNRDCTLAETQFGHRYSVRHRDRLEQDLPDMPPRALY